MFIILFTAVLLSGCEEQQIHINVENYLDFLEITDENQPEVRPLLTKASEIVESYNKSIETGLDQSDKRRYSREDLLELKTEFLEQLHPVMIEIDEQLDDSQRFSWRRTELIYYYNETREYVLKNFNSAIKISYETTVSPGRSSQVQRGSRLQSPFELWTVYFGLPMYSFYTGNTSGSISQRGRNSFPISIQATLMDKSLRDLEKDKPNSLPSDVEPESVVEIRVHVSSRLHPNYSDINNWIPFIRLPDGSEIEPRRIIEQDEEWFKERNLLISSRLPSFLSTPLSARNSQQGRQGLFGMGRGRGSGGGRGRFSEEISQVYNTYYQLLFPAQWSNKPVIAPGTNYLELIFLEEIGSESNARGTWKFVWRTP
ncbi:hypothetical protein IID62_00670 [candidate division KSB1 bacterium]|nr:hypothetical protein [candidate division KSB1 bacterium]